MTCREKSNQLQTNNMEYGLYQDLASALPSGVYRLRVYQELSLFEDKWLSSEDSPSYIEFANDRFYEILHLDRSSFINNPGIISRFIYEEDKTQFAKINVEANKYKTPFEWEGRFLIDNNLIWTQFKSIPRVLENGDIIWTGTLNDITQRKQIEEDIKHKNAELQRLSDDKDILMSILAHDLITPFNSMLGFLDLLSENLREYDVHTLGNYISIVNNSAKGAFNLLNDILLWTRSQSGAIPFEPKIFNLKSSIDEVTEFLKPNANTKNITINIDESDKTVVFADVDMLNTILRNLISNAIKFTDLGGIVNISSERTESDILVTISDNGIGIAPNILPRLFDTTKLYSTRGTANEKGTCFGLMLCKKFVEEHGGEIWAESELSKGSKFKFTLPLNE